MGFNFSNAIAEAAKEAAGPKSLGLMILGASGAGKSSLAGTFGVKTLYLSTNGEVHGSAAAKGLGGANVVPVSIDFADGKPLNADKAYDRLLSILTDVKGIEDAGFKAVVVDSATELEIMIRETTRWKVMCQTDKGTHNSWAEGKATLAMFRPVIDALKSLQKQTGAHFAMTCALEINAVADNGEITESKPRLQTYSVVEGVIQQFGDIIAVGRMSNGEQEAHRIQFLAGVSRDSKDAKGVVRKSLNFNPRVTGIPLEKLPRTMEADLKQLIKLKEGK